MASEKQQRIFDRTQKRLIKQSQQSSDKIVFKLGRALSQTRQRIAAELIGAEGFELIHFEQLKRATNESFAEFAERYKVILDEATIEQFELGQQIIDEPLSRVGADIKVSAMPQLNLDVLEAQTARNTQFIKGLSSEAAEKINNNILVGITGEKTPFQTMKDIGRNLKDPSTFKSIFHRAEAITRTEMGTALNTATTKRFEQAANVIPGLKKYWIWSHKVSGRPEHRAVERDTNPAFGGIPIPVKQKFKVRNSKGDIERALGPHQPGLSAGNVINCGCRTGTFIDEKTETEETIGRIFI